MTVLQRVCCVSCPLISLLAAIPIITEVLPFEISSGEYHWEFWLVGGAVCAGLVAAPGYLYLVLSNPSCGYEPGTRIWLACSLMIGMLASLVGAGFTYLLFWPAIVFPATSAIICAWLLYAVLFGRRCTA